MRNLVESIALSFPAPSRWVVLLVLLAAGHLDALQPAEVLILVNRDTPISSDVAKMYERARQIPHENVLALHLGTEHYINREQYRTKIAEPVKKHLGEHAGIRCILTTAGVPYVVVPSEGRQDGASVDSELAAVLREEPKDWNGWQPNPLYLLSHHAVAEDPRQAQMVYVARLDGPDLKTITRMVEDAVATERDGLVG